jgi:hypothetical protein
LWLLVLLVQLKRLVRELVREQVLALALGLAQVQVQVREQPRVFSLCQPGRYLRWRWSSPS